MMMTRRRMIYSLLLSHGLSNPAQADRRCQLSNLNVTDMISTTLPLQCTDVACRHRHLCDYRHFIIIITLSVWSFYNHLISSYYPHCHRLKWNIYRGAKTRVAGGHYRRKRQPSHLWLRFFFSAAMFGQILVYVKKLFNWVWVALFGRASKAETWIALMRRHPAARAFGLIRLFALRWEKTFYTAPPHH